MADPFEDIEGGDFALREVPRTGKIILRGDPGDNGFTDAVREALDIDLPLAANTSSETAPLSALWLGPDEWMLICATGSEAAVMTSPVSNATARSIAFSRGAIRFPQGPQRPDHRRLRGHQGQTTRSCAPAG